MEFRGAAEALHFQQAKEILIEGPAGTGKSLACLAKCVAACEVYNCRVLIARASRVSMTESVLVTLERELLVEGHPAREGSDVTRAGRRNYRWPHGSEIVVRGLDNTESVMSSEYDLIYVAEATEITEEDWERLLTRLRNHCLPFQQAIADCNPGAPGHWLNRRAESGRMVRLCSKHRDNPTVTPEYMDTLSGLTGHRRVRLFEGRWTAAEGAVFPEFSEAIHVVDDFTPPADWPWYVGVDPGFAHPTGAPWVCVSPVGDLYVGDEIYEGGKSITQHVETILRMCTGRTVRKWFGDPHEFFSNRAQGESWAVQSKKAGLPTFMPWAAQEKGAMVNAYRQLLQNSVTRAQTGVRPGVCLYVMKRCKNVIMEHQSWAFKRNAKGELSGGGDDQFADENNHLVGDPLVGMVATGQLKYVAPGVGAVELPNG